MNTEYFPLNQSSTHSQVVAASVLENVGANSQLTFIPIFSIIMIFRKSLDSLSSS